MLIIFAGTNGYLDDLPVEQCRKFEDELYRFVENAHTAAFWEEIRDEEGARRRACEAKSEAVIKEFKAALHVRREEPHMPSLIDIRRRIRSVKNTQQITKAMKMVSAAKLRRAQERVIASRPYGTLLRQVLANVAAAAANDEKAGEQSAARAAARAAHPAGPGHRRSRSGRRVQLQPDQAAQRFIDRAPRGVGEDWS